MAVRKRRERKTTDEVWREIIGECQRSGLSPDAFCKRERYSIEAFRHFQETLFGDRDENEPGTSNDDQPPPKSPGLRRRPRKHLTTDLLGNEPLNRSPHSTAGKNTEDSNTVAILEIVLTTGVLLRVTSNCSSQLLKSVVSVLEEIR